jgi:hypothetical protein
MTGRFGVRAGSARALEAGELIGIRALFRPRGSATPHGIATHGSVFAHSPTHPLRLILSIKDRRATLDNLGSR